MVRFPWRREDEHAEAQSEEPHSDGETTDEPEQKPYHRTLDALVECRFQDGTLFVFDGQLYIERPSRSKFESKWIGIDELEGVNYTRRVVIHYIQFEQRGFENDEGGFLSTPVDENTLHFGGGKRSCAERARDEILTQL